MIGAPREVKRMVTVDVDTLEKLMDGHGNHIGYILPLSVARIDIPVWRTSTNPLMLAINEELKKHFPGKPASRETKKDADS